MANIQVIWSYFENRLKNLIIWYHRMTDLKLEKKVKEVLNFKGVVELVKPDTIEQTTMGEARWVMRKY